LYGRTGKKRAVRTSLLLNRVNLQGVQGNLANSTFGRSTSTYDPRIIQLGARLTF
jgi:hypothetical protein